MTTLFVISDRDLRDMVRNNVAGDIGSASFFEPDRSMNCYQGPEPDFQQIRSAAQVSDRVIVGFTGRFTNECWAIEAAAEFNKPCGLIVQADQLPVWASLSVIHSLRPFEFVIAIGLGAPRHVDSWFKIVRFFRVFDPNYRRLSELMGCREYT